MKLDLPVGWEIKKLGNVCVTTSGGTPSRKEAKYYNGNIAWIKSGELDKGLILDSEEKITAEAIKNSSAKIFPKGTLLIALYGATIGKLAFLGIDAATNQAICGIFRNEHINQQYLYNYLLFKRPQLIKQGIGGAQPNISQTILKDLDIPLPTLTEQQLIVEKIEELFSELDKGIENLKTAQQQLKVYRQAVLKWAFEGKLTNDDVQDGELPKGWERLTLGSIAQKSSLKISPSQMPNAHFIGMDCIKSNALKLHVLYTFQDFKSAGNYFKKDQVLYGRMRPYLNKVYKAEFDGACSGEFIVLQCKTNFIPDLLKYILHSREFVTFANHKTAGDRPRISYEEITDYPIAVCSINEQQKIVDEIDSRLSVCDKIEESITTSLQQAEALRQSILKKAFEGKLVRAHKVKPLYKPKNEYFYQVQVLGMIAEASKQIGINHGEMTIAKYAYLLDKLFQIPTFYNYQRWHLGPYPPQIKKAIANTQFFTRINNSIEVKDFGKLNQYHNPFTEQIRQAINELNKITVPRPGKSRAHQTELFATVCKVVEDIQTADLSAVRQSMAEWSVDLPNTSYKSKAAKFSEVETNLCLDMLAKNEWLQHLVKK
jgi:type I restriction enzyme S subunit